MQGKWQFPHRRWNPLRQAWVMVSPHRTQRPWQGEVAQKTTPSGVAYDPECYLCPGNKRAGGVVNPQYDSIFTFVNDYAALLPEDHSGCPTSHRDAGDHRARSEDEPRCPGSASSGVLENQAGTQSDIPSSPLLLAEPARGLCRVLCFHPDHSLTLARMTQPEIRRVVDAWTREYEDLGAIDWIKYVQIFENRGAMMGASNPHPHGQIWSTGFVPDEPAAETAAQREYLAKNGRCLLCDYVAAELAAAGERIVFANDHFAVLVPWWAIWPFEVLLVSRRHAGAMPELNSDERDALADALKRLTTRYDNLFETSFPYTMGFHQKPTTGVPGNRSTVAGMATDGQSHAEWHFHAHFYPPLLRSATVRKFMVGFEMLGMPQRDITPESAAERLRACSEEHFWPRG